MEMGRLDIVTPHRELPFIVWEDIALTVTLI
jgi:hypothetical protein